QSCPDGSVLDSLWMRPGATSGIEIDTTPIRCYRDTSCRMLDGVFTLDGSVWGPEPRMARLALRADDRHRGEPWLCAGRVPKSLFSAPFAFPIYLIRRLTILCRV